jgi:hypothetical protein
MEIGYPSVGTERPWADLPPANIAITASRSGENMSRETELSPKPSKRKGSMHRSKSTPNVRTMADDESSVTDKKRNKLGYHRTAVACGQFAPRR